MLASPAPAESRCPQGRDIRVATRGAGLERLAYQDLKGHIPLVPIVAAKAAHCHLKVAPFDPDRLASEQSMGYLLPCRTEQPLKGGARDIHLTRTFLLP